MPQNAGDSLSARIEAIRPELEYLADSDYSAAWVAKKILASVDPV